MGYNGYTEKKKASNEKYLNSLKTIVVRMKPDELKEIEKEAAKRGQSRNAFILDSIKEKIERES